MTTRLSFLIGLLVAGVFGLAWSIRVTTRAPVGRNTVRTPVVVEETIARRRAPEAAPGTTARRQAQPGATAPEGEAGADAARKTATETDAANPAPPTDEEFDAELSAFGRSLRDIIIGNENGAQVAAHLREVLRRGGPERLQELLDRFADESEEMGARIVIAHALAQSNDPRAIAELAGYLRDPDAGLLVQRYASHALAFSEADGVEDILLDVATHTAERGTRANAAFGLARRGSDEGLRLYFGAMDEAFDAGDPGALQYLGGLRLLGERALPGVRERLATYKNEQALLVLIGGVKAAGDRQSLPILERLAYDTTQPVSIQKAAQGAIRAMSAAN